MARAFAIDFDIARVERLADRLSELSTEEFGRAALTVVNQVIDETYEIARPRMLRTLNLTDSYVRDRMRVEHASNPNSVKGAIVASGARSDMTVLARYDSKQTLRDVNWSNDRILAMGKTFGAWPGWTKRTGDKLRGVPVNQKVKGMSVEVTRGSRKPIENAFYMPLRNGNGMGLFTREGDGKKNYKHRYGPSVYQMFSFVAKGLVDEVGTALETQLADEAERLLQKALT